MIGGAMAPWPPLDPPLHWTCCIFVVCFWLWLSLSMYVAVVGVFAVMNVRSLIAGLWFNVLWQVVHVTLFHNHHLCGRHHSAVVLSSSHWLSQICKVWMVTARHITVAVMMTMMMINILFNHAQLRTSHINTVLMHRFVNCAIWQLTNRWDA